MCCPLDRHEIYKCGLYYKAVFADTHTGSSHFQLSASFKQASVVQSKVRDRNFVRKLT